MRPLSLSSWCWTSWTSISRVKLSKSKTTLPFARSSWRTSRKRWLTWRRPSLRRRERPTRSWPRRRLESRMTPRRQTRRRPKSRMTPRVPRRARKRSSFFPPEGERAIGVSRCVSSPFLLQKKLETKKTGSARFLVCGRWELNPQVLRHTVLSRTRLPVSSRPQVWLCNYKFTIKSYWKILVINFIQQFY